MDYPEFKTMHQICTEIDALLNKPHPLSCIDLIGKNKFKQLRSDFNTIFEVGDAKPVFKGSLDYETEYGDFTDIVARKMFELYPPNVVGNPSAFKLNITQRTRLRDQIIEALDEGLRGA